MNRLVMLKAIREMAETMQASNASPELGCIYDIIKGACKHGISIMEDKGWSE